MTYHKISDKTLLGFKKICDDKGITYKTDQEYRDSAQQLVSYVSLLVEIDQAEQARKKRLDTEPKGYALAGEGRSCSLCGQTVYGTDGWYDKWGFKFMNCQNAVDKRIIPGSMCRDYQNEKCVTDSTLSRIADLRLQTIRKLIRTGKIKARKIPSGPYVILRKDNPDLRKVLKRITI